MATVLLALCPAPRACVGIFCYASSWVAGQDTHHKGIAWTHTADVLCSSPRSHASDSFPPSLLSEHSKASKHFLYETGSPSTSQEASGIWPQLWLLLQLKKKQCAIWKLDMVWKQNPTCKQLRMWVMCDTQPHICTQFAQRIPVIFWGWNKTLVQQTPQLWRAEIWSNVFQPGFPSDKTFLAVTPEFLSS